MEKCLYRENKDIKHFVGMMDGLAFLPTDEVGEGMKFLKENAPTGCEELLQYFDATYVSGSFRQIRHPLCDGNALLRLRRMPPLHIIFCSCECIFCDITCSKLNVILL